VTNLGHPQNHGQQVQVLPTAIRDTHNPSGHQHPVNQFGTPTIHRDISIRSISSGHPTSFHVGWDIHSRSNSIQIKRNSGYTAGDQFGTPTKPWSAGLDPANRNSGHPQSFPSPNRGPVRDIHKKVGSFQDRPSTIGDTLHLSVRIATCNLVRTSSRPNTIWDQFRTPVKPWADSIRDTHKTLGTSTIQFGTPVKPWAAGLDPANRNSGHPQSIGASSIQSISSGHP